MVSRRRVSVHGERRMGEGATGARRAATTWWCRPTRMPPRTAWTTSCPTWTRRSARRWPPSATCRISPSRCSAASIPARSTSPIPSAPPRPGAWPAWASTSMPPGAGWPTTAPTGSCRATGTGAGWQCSRSRGSMPRSPCRDQFWRADSAPPCISAPRPTRASRWCGPRCTATCAGWPTSAPPPRAAAPVACRSTSTTWTAPSRRWPGRAPTASSVASCSPPCR